MQTVLYILFCRIRVIAQELPDRQHHAGCAVPALQAVMRLERRLNRVQAVWRADVLDRGDLGSVGLRGPHRAGFDRRVAELHRAGAALGGVAADVGSGEPEFVAQEVHQQRACWDGCGAFVAVDGYRHRHHAASGQCRNLRSFTVLTIAA